jgi:hypothetical protein
VDIASASAIIVIIIVVELVHSRIVPLSPSALQVAL